MAPPTQTPSHKLVWSHATAHCLRQAWKRQKSWIKLVSAEEMPNGGLAAPADPGVRSERAFARHSLAGAESCAGNLSTGGGPGSWHCRGEGTRVLEASGRTHTGHCPTRNVRQSHLSPGPALPGWPGNRLLRRPALAPGPARVPGEGRRMQPPGGSQGPGETWPVLKRQGGWPLCLGSLPGMTGPGLGACSLLAQGSLSPRQGGRS